jgi:hypothetical protein
MRSRKIICYCISDVFYNKEVKLVSIRVLIIIIHYIHYPDSPSHSIDYPGSSGFVLIALNQITLTANKTYGKGISPSVFVARGRA